MARNDLAKKIIPMGAPLFEYQNLLEREEAEVFSSNYELYADMSRRVTNKLYEYTPELEKYSIDEAFLELQPAKKSFDYIGREMKDRIRHHLGMPVGVGIAANKTLAKVANKIAIIWN